MVNQRFDFIKEVDNVGLGWGEGGEGGGGGTPYNGLYGEASP